MFVKHKPLTNDEMTTIFVTNEDRTPIVENFIPLALTIAKKIPQKYLEREEARGIALLELAECIDRIQHTKNLVAYVSLSITKRLMQQKRRYFKRSVIKCCTVVGTLTEKPLTIANEPSYRQKFDLDLNDLIAAAVTSDMQKEVMKLVLENYNDTEIARQLGTSQQNIWKIKNGLIKKMRKLLT